MTPAELQAAHDAPSQPAGAGAWSADYLAGRRHPLSMRAAVGLRRRVDIERKCAPSSACPAASIRRSPRCCCATQGEPIAGLFMQNWADDGSGDCRADDDRRDAVAVCGRLGIPFHFRNFVERILERRVRSISSPSTRAGRTPNPDVLCNREIKFKHFLDAARALGAERIATGHYARVERDRDGAGACCARRDRDKDQSYFLHQLGQAQLAATLFPLGELPKDRGARDRARRRRCRRHAKKDSTGICFIGERDFREFLGALPACAARRNPQHPQGERGRRAPRRVLLHARPARRAAASAACAGAMPAPWYVVGKDVARQRAGRRPGQRQPASACRTRCGREAAHWIAGAPPARAIRLHRADPLSAARRGLHGDGRRRRQRWRYASPGPARGHARAVAGAVRRRRLPRRRRDRPHRCRPTRCFQGVTRMSAAA